MRKPGYSAIVQELFVTGRESAVTNNGKPVITVLPYKMYEDLVRSVGVEEEV